jgi:hypothetical protein
MRAAHVAKEQLRKQLEARQIAEHKAFMAERRKKFEKRFKHVWTTGPTGLSLIWVTLPNQAKGEGLVSAWFKDTMVADVE